ncbi:MAG: YigZ family protein [Eggerthellaceae bacterium]
MASYLTIEGCASAEIEEKKSRFIAQIAHVETEEAALEFLSAIKAEHRMARHNVYAYILRGSGASDRIRYSDDGEPQKTAGLPTLQVLQHAELTDVIAVVTRYFGGTLLGTGGLVRAYTQATQAAIEAAIEAAILVTISRCIDISLTIPYQLYDQMVRIAADEQAKTISTTYTDTVHLVLRMLEGTQEPLLKKVRELCHGNEQIELSEVFDAAF